MKLDEAKRTRLIIDIAGTAFCVAATAVFYVLALGPMLVQENQADTFREKVNAQRAIARGLTQTLAKGKTALRQAKRELAESPLHLAPVTAVNTRILAVTTLARECGLKLDVVLPGATSRGLRYETVPIHLSGTGNYRTCVDLLHRLRLKFPDTTVSSLDLGADPADPKAVARFSIDLMWHAASKAGGPRAGG